MTVKTQRFMPAAPATKSVANPVSKFLFGQTLQKLNPTGTEHRIRTFAAGTTYTMIAVTIRGFRTTAYVIDGETFVQI